MAKAMGALDGVAVGNAAASVIVAGATLLLLYFSTRKPAYRNDIRVLATGTEEDQLKLSDRTNGYE
jgi:hypothetical protein